MSYNTRRSTGNMYSPNMNQRMMSNRGMGTPNFIQGSNTQFRQSQPMNEQQRPQWSQQQSLQQKQQSQARPNTQPSNSQPQQQQTKPVTPALPLKSALKKTEEPPATPGILKQEVPKLQPTPAPQPQQVPFKNETNGAEKMDDSEPQDPNTDSTEEPPRKILKVKAGKISKREKRGRRNQRLRKILQPKNALMVLNELVGGQKFTITEKDAASLPGRNFTEPETFVATVTIDGMEHYGYGKNKSAAKTNAAEVALKHIITHKLSNLNKGTNLGTDAEGDVLMKEDSAPAPAPAPEAVPTGEALKAPPTAEEEDVSWVHIASFAMYKLFASWDTDGTLTDQMQEVRAPVNNPPMLKKPAKQLPENPHLMNPVMLLNQMKPGTVYDDVAKEGNSPNAVFTVKTQCDGFEFFGKGPNKKAARKNCAYAVCHKIYNIDYPSEDFQPQLQPVAIN